MPSRTTWRAYWRSDGSKRPPKHLERGAPVGAMRGLYDDDGTWYGLARLTAARAWSASALGL